jgi:hypothetical protein
MNRRTWGWKLKYMILFLWIFLFSCKAHQAEENTELKTQKEMIAASALLCQWIQSHVDNTE